MRHLANQVELFTRIEGFLAKNLSPVLPPTSTTAPTGEPVAVTR